MDEKIEYVLIGKASSQVANLCCPLDGCQLLDFRFELTKLASTSGQHGANVTSSPISVFLCLHSAVWVDDACPHLSRVIVAREVMDDDLNLGKLIHVYPRQVITKNAFVIRFGLFVTILSRWQRLLMSGLFLNQMQQRKPQFTLLRI